MKQEILTLELNMNWICKDTIKKRKAIYGNNLPVVAEMESNYFGIIITPSMIAYSLAILKQVRIDFIRSKLQVLKNDINFDTYILQKEIEQLRNGLEDSLKDYSNYLWISQNYAEYEAL
jgi:hypothetical protein